MPVDGEEVVHGLRDDRTNAVDAGELPLGVYVWPPGASRPKLIAHSGYVDWAFAANGRVFFDGRVPLGLVGLNGGRVAAVGAPGGAPRGLLRGRHVPPPKPSAAEK